VRNPHPNPLLSNERELKKSFFRKFIDCFLRDAIEVEYSEIVKSVPWVLLG